MISLLTDFESLDSFVDEMKAVILSICPEIACREANAAGRGRVRIGSVVDVGGV